MRANVPSSGVHKRRPAPWKPGDGTEPYIPRRIERTQKQTAAALGILRQKVDLLEQSAMRKVRAKMELLQRDEDEPRSVYRGFIDGIRVDPVRGGYAAEAEMIPGAFAVDRCPWTAAADAAGKAWVTLACVRLGRWPEEVA